MDSCKRKERNNEKELGNMRGSENREGRTGDVALWYSAWLTYTKLWVQSPVPSETKTTEVRDMYFIDR